MLLKTLFFHKYYIGLEFIKNRVNSLNQITHMLDDFPASKFVKITHSDGKKRK